MKRLINYMIVLGGKEPHPLHFGEEHQESKTSVGHKVSASRGF
jgi:hypothetical protein